MIDMEPIRRQVSGESYAEALRRRKETEKAKGGAAAPPQPSDGGPVGDTIQVRSGVRKERLDLLDRYYAAQRNAAH